jgi:hypothetical protein
MLEIACFHVESHLFALLVCMESMQKQAVTGGRDCESKRSRKRSEETMEAEEIVC